MEDLNRQAEAIEGLKCAENKIQLQKKKKIEKSNKCLWRWKKEMEERLCQSLSLQRDRISFIGNWVQADKGPGSEELA